MYDDENVLCVSESLFCIDERIFFHCVCFVCVRVCVLYVCESMFYMLVRLYFLFCSVRV